MNPVRPELDGLRGIAALIVVVSHVSNETMLWGGVFGFGGGQIGVMLFFALSGYLMGALYLDRPFGEVCSYVRNRIGRVVPLYLAAVVAAYLFYLAGGSAPVTSHNLLSHLAFVSGASVFWTVPVEVQFYAAFVAIWFLYGMRPRIVVAGLICMLAASIAFPVDSARFGSSLALTYPFFLLGLLTSRIIRIDAPRKRPDALALVLAFGLLVLLFPGLYERFLPSRWPYIKDMWADPVYLLAVFSCLVVTLQARAARRWIGCDALAFIGRISYSIYLLHLPIICALSVFTPLGRWPFLFLLVTLGVTTIAARSAYEWFEVPARNAVRNGFGGRDRLPGREAQRDQVVLKPTARAPAGPNLSS